MAGARASPKEAAELLQKGAAELLHATLHGELGAVRAALDAAPALVRVPLQVTPNPKPNPILTITITLALTVILILNLTLTLTLTCRCRGGSTTRARSCTAPPPRATTTSCGSYSPAVPSSP